MQQSQQIEVVEGIMNLENLIIKALIKTKNFIIPNIKGISTIKISNTFEFNDNFNDIYIKKKVFLLVL